MSNIIGICGTIGSGKGTVADILVENGYTKISFADRLKDGVASMFGWNRSLLQGDSQESRDWREQPDPFWTKEIGKEITPRYVLQKVGTDCMRHGLWDNLWVSLVKQEIEANHWNKYVIPDVRFPNEMKALQDIGGKIVLVEREERPLYWATARNVNENNVENDPYNAMRVVFGVIHESEWRWIFEDEKYDAIIKNIDTLDDLKHQVQDLLLSNQFQ